MIISYLDIVTKSVDNVILIPYNPALNWRTRSRLNNKMIIDRCIERRLQGEGPIEVFRCNREAAESERRV